MSKDLEHNITFGLLILSIYLTTLQLPTIVEMLNIAWLIGLVSDMLLMILTSLIKFFSKEE